MEDFIKREIDKIGLVLEMIFSKLGAGVRETEMQQTVREEMLRGLSVDIDKVLEGSDPGAYLASRSFTPSQMEDLAEIAFRCADPRSADFAKKLQEHFAAEGYFSMRLSMITGFGD